MRSLAQTYWSIGQLDRSISLFEETLALRVKTFGHDHPETLSAMGCVGVNYGDAGRLKEAIPLLEEACQRADKLQPCPASLLFIPSVLAETYEGTGLFAKAEPLYVKTLEERRSALGE